MVGSTDFGQVGRRCPRVLPGAGSSEGSRFRPNPVRCPSRMARRAALWMRLSVPPGGSHLSAPRGWPAPSFFAAADRFVRGETGGRREGSPGCAASAKPNWRAGRKTKRPVRCRADRNSSRRVATFLAGNRLRQGERNLSQVSQGNLKRGTGAKFSGTFPSESRFYRMEAGAARESEEAWYCG